MRGQAVERCGAKNGRRRDESRSENEPLMNTERRGSNRLTRSSYVASPLRILAEMRKHPGGSGVNMAMSAAVQPDRSRCSAFNSTAPSEVCGISGRRSAGATSVPSTTGYALLHDMTYLGIPDGELRATRKPLR